MGAGLEREGHESYVSSHYASTMELTISTDHLTELKNTPLSTLDTPKNSPPVLDTLLDNRTSSPLELELVLVESPLRVWDEILNLLDRLTTLPTLPPTETLVPELDNEKDEFPVQSATLNQSTTLEREWRTSRWSIPIPKALPISPAVDKTRLMEIF